MDEPETWRWVWLVTMAVFGLGEMHVAGAFFLAPFAVGAAVAAVLAFADIGLAVEWAAFVGVSVGTFAALRPVARRLDRGQPTLGIGSKRLIGEPATVLQEIPAGVHELGMVRVHREEWRAESMDGTELPVGTTVQVVEQRGTRLVVTPTEGA